MEDGKNRHLFLLQAKREEVLKILPDELLKDHLDFMKLNIKGRSFPLSLISCCLSNKYRHVSSDFTESFSSLKTEDKINYYRKYLECSILVAKKKLKLPCTMNALPDLPSGKETSSVLYRTSRCDDWRTTIVTLDSTNRILETLTMKILLNKAFVYRSKESWLNDEIIVVCSWKNKHNQLFLMRNSLTQSNFFQRIESQADNAIEDNIIRMVQGEERIQTQTQLTPPSERSLRNRMVQEVPHYNKETVKEVQLASYLKYRHPVEPTPKQSEASRLISTGDVHYFFEGQWEIDSDGQLVAINSKKLQAQGSVIKYIIKRLFTGTKIFSISLPVSVFSEQSNLSLLINSYRHAPLELEAAAQLEDPLQRFLKVIRFAFTAPPCYIRCDKPFNPIIGETYQVMVDGTPFYGQQVSHHPPISAVFIKGRGYTAYGSFEAEVKFGVNSASGNNKGWLKISFDMEDISKKVIRFNNAPGEMSGMLIGSRKLSLKDHIQFVDEEKLLFCKIQFGKVKYQKGKEYKDSVEGRVLRLKRQIILKEPFQIEDKDIQQDLGLISGRWLSEIFFNNTLLINTLKQYPPVMERYSALLPSDYSLREDVMLKKKGDEEGCQAAKEKLEELQRADRKLREKYTN